MLDRDALLRYGDELRKQQVVVANDRNEAWNKGLDLVNKKSLHIPGDAAASALDYILGKWKGFDAPWSELQGKRVLDLAAGSASITPSGVWYPHFSRLCAINGADVTAIDLNPQSGLDKTMFTWASENLVDVVLNGGLQGLQILQGKEFDLIHSANFIGFNFSPQLHDQLMLRGLSRCGFEEAFQDQARRLLTDGGVMSLSRSGSSDHYLPMVHTRRGSSFVQLSP